MIPFPDKKYKVIYADPPWEYPQSHRSKSARGMAWQHYNTMQTDDICNLPVTEICECGAVCFLWATFPRLPEALKVMEAWGFRYIGAAFVWVKKYKKSGFNYWGMGQYTRSNAEVCLLGVMPEFRATKMIKSHKVHQIVEAPFDGHSRKPDEVRRRIVELLGEHFRRCAGNPPLQLHIVQRAIHQMPEDKRFIFPANQ